jgi:hypothetical protein
MSTNDTTAQSRPIQDVERIVMRDYGELFVSQGDQESLTIEGDPEVLALVRTEVQGGTLDILRRPLRYRVTVRTLSALDILGAARAQLDGIETARLALVLGGAGQIRATPLTAEHLDVDIRGAGRVKVTGRVGTQEVTVEGAGLYDARRLESGSASIEIRGAGAATVSVETSLSVVIQGMGSVDYYGPPTVERSISGLGTVNHLLSD